MPLIRKLTSHPLFSGSLIMVGGNMVVNAINYFYHLVMGRVLGPSDYGTLAALYSVLYIVGIVPSSTSVAIVKFISSAKGKDEVRRIYMSIKRATFYLGLGLTLVIFLFSPLISNFLNIGNAFMTSLVGIIFYLSVITLVNQATSQGLLQFTGQVLPNLISGITKFIVGIFLVLAGWSVFGAMVGVVMAAFLAYLYSWRFINRLLKVKAGNHYNLRPFLKYSLPVLLQALSFTAFFTVDVILVKHFFPPLEAGLYAALSMLGKIIYFAASPIAATMFPIISGRKAMGESYLKVFLTALGVTVLVSLSVVVFYKVFPELAIGLLYGEKYLQAQAELFWMGLFIFFYTLSFLLVNFFLSVGITRVTVLPIIASLLQTVMIWFWHGSIMQVIQISLALAIFLFGCLFVILIRNQICHLKSFFR